MWFVHSLGVALHRWRLRQRSKAIPRRATLREVLSDLEFEMAHRETLCPGRAMVVSSPSLLYPIPQAHSIGPVLVVEVSGSAYDAAIRLLSYSVKFQDLQILEVLQRPSRQAEEIQTRVILGLNRVKSTLRH